MKLREKKVNVFGKPIPLIAVVAMVFIMGIAGAALVQTLTTGVVTIAESIDGSVTEPLVIPVPGGEDTVTLAIANSAALVTYGLNVTPVVSYTGGEENVTVEAGVPDGIVITTAGVTDMEYNIVAADSGTIIYTVTIDPAAPTGDLEIKFTIERLAVFP